jgi:signal transduction histidine kinase/CheY-like chemotaxis protein
MKPYPAQAVETETRMQTTPCCPPLPPDEPARLAALHKLAILDTEPEREFNRIVDLAADIFNVPVAVISLIDRDRQWFKATHGTDLSGTPRQHSFCAYAILSDEVCLVPDATRDARFANNPLVTGEPGIRFYAGAPLHTDDGYKVGALCLIDFLPRADFGPRAQETLNKLADIAADALRLRLRKAELRQSVEENAAARRVAEQANAVKAEFVQTVSHELRTPLGAIIGMADMLGSSGLQRDQLHYVTTLRDAADHLLFVINNILDFSKLEAEAIEFDPHPCNLTELVEGTAAVPAPVAQAHELELGTIFGPDLPRDVMCDRMRLRQVLLNLVGNALKFTNFGGVSIEITKAGEEQDGMLPLRFAVKDTGIGISQADLPRLFERFSQLRASTAREYGGSGLGLAISHRLVRLMGGELEVSSVFGQGSEFSFTLKLRLQPGATAPSWPDFAGKHVLVASANPVTCHVLKNLLTTFGAHPASVASMREIAPLLHRARQQGAAFETLILGAETDMDLEAEAEAAQSTQAYSGLHVVRLLRQAAATPDGATGLAEPVTETRLAAALRAKSPVSEPQNQDAPPPAPLPAGERLSILLVEDNEINQMVAVAMLTSLGHEVDIATNGLDAITTAATGKYALILMDMMMPGIDGPTAARAIRNLGGAEAQTYIIALTANASAEHRALCTEAGMNDFLTKPVTRTHLRMALARYTAWNAARLEPRNA